MTQISAIFILALFTIHPSFASTSSEVPHPGPRSQEQAKFLYQEAMEALKTGKTELAQEDFQKILKTYPQFSEKFVVYQELMKLQLTKKNYPEVLSLAKEALLQHPMKGITSAIQLMRAEAQLQSGNALKSKIIAEEILKSKPDENTITSALLYKAESLSQLGKNKEAFASLDAAKSNPKFADAELKIRARACSSQKRQPKQDALEYFHEKNLCFKESAALSKSYPASDAAQVWCDRFEGFQAELSKTKIDEFTLQKIQAEMQTAKALSATWGCK
jgi:outer membrane protein assembly factor BamD (BamD/ComL family)